MRIIIAILLSIFTITCSGQKTSKPEKVEGRFIVERLDEVGYFALTDSTNLDIVKKDVAESYDKLSYFGGVLSDTTLHCLDNRFYWIDSETLFEFDGLWGYLDEVKNTFERLGLKLEYENYAVGLDVDNPDYIKCSIDLNGKKYIAFEGNADMMSWEIAFRNFVEMLNDQLRLQGSKEQVYMVYTGNDSQIVFLTDEMYKIVREYYPNDDNLPRSLEERKKMK